MNAVVNLLKPAGMTSHDAVYFLRRLTGIKRIGHTGTLDPMAAGVLPLCIGSAARISEYLELDRKTYRCEMILGIATDTLDIWGTLIEDRRARAAEIAQEDICRAMEPLRGLIFQTPPKYSAIRIGGRRLYEYARSGQEVEIPRRPAVIYRLELLRFDRASGRVLFEVECSKGTYVRSICSDIGQALCAGAAMSILVRSQSGELALSGAVTPQELAQDWKQHLIAPDRLLSQLGSLRLRRGRGSWFSNGGWLTERDLAVRSEPAFAGLSHPDAQANGLAPLPCGPQAAEGRQEPPLAAVIDHMKLSPRLLHTYRVYEDGRFLGTALWDAQQNKFTVDKVFRDESI